MSAPIVIVGAGLGGLSAALHLAGAGREVTVLERAATPGGRAGVIHDSGYTFDTGPSVLTMPELIADAFAAVGEELEDWLKLTRLDPAYRARFHDGSTIDVLSDPQRMAAQIGELCSAADAAGYLRYVDFLRRLYRVEMPNFIDRDVSQPRSLINPGMIELLRMGGMGRLAPKVAHYLRDERLQRLFTFQALYAGVAPTRALALYAVIGFMDSVNGVYAPSGGMHALPSAMAAAAAKHGVTLRYRTEVARVEVHQGRATAVITAAGERVRASTVLINADLPEAYRRLIPSGAPRRLARVRYSPSCVVLHIGTRTPPPATTTHHVISFGAAWDRTFDEIITRGEVMSDPSILISTPSLSDPSLAPEGRHTHFVLFPAPNLDHSRPLHWDELATGYREHMIETLQARGFTGLGDGIEVAHLVTPADWLRQGLGAGTPFAAAHTFTQTGPFRSQMQAPGYENVLFCGSNTQPGVGVPMVLISGKLAAARIINGGVLRR
ncbi:phytoene desaturase [Jatrophihabitans sp. GAS493]|uniref:phytoene desaturase family protein n=1 Tax=Jatrophihabitans sp. GAS493 TaxID=1907575 RepID=UPI000BB96C15|nr:phytoene desaturase family protein [Jatrophihabitans sp. GAS493]SOD74352.1 phytoene desaturase [Jatrophihabitans sp. GAS493]